MKRVIFIALAAAAATFACKYLFCEEQTTQQPTAPVTTQEEKESNNEEVEFLKFLEEQLKQEQTDESISQAQNNDKK